MNEIISAIIAVMSAASTALNWLYFFRFRKIGTYATLRLVNGIVTAYTCYAHISLLVGCPTAHVALMFSTALMSAQMLVWAVINYYYLPSHRDCDGKII